MRTLSIRVRNLCVRWAYGSGTDACTEHTSQELIRALSAHMKFEKVSSKHAEHTHQDLMRTLSNEHTCQELMHTPKELIRALSVRVRNWCVSSACASEIKWCLAPPKIKIISLYFIPKVTYPEKLYGVKIMKIRAIENSHFGTFKGQWVAMNKNERVLMYIYPVYYTWWTKAVCTALHYLYSC